eukprot:8595693-Alexandrium_andersonii.AAC.1
MPRLLFRLPEVGKAGAVPEDVLHPRDRVLATVGAMTLGPLEVAMEIASRASAHAATHDHLVVPRELQGQL